MRRIVTVVVLAVSVLFFGTLAFSHPGHEEKDNHPFPSVTSDLKNGEALYKKNCASCHGEKGDGKGPAASFLTPKPSNFLDKVFMTRRARVDHYEGILNGKPGTPMMPYKGKLSEKEIWDIATHLEHLFSHSADKNHAGHK